MIKYTNSEHKKIFNEKDADKYQIGDLVEFIGGMNQYKNYDVGCGIVVDKYVGLDNSSTAFRIWFELVCARLTGVNTDDNF